MAAKVLKEGREGAAGLDSLTLPEAAAAAACEISKHQQNNNKDGQLLDAECIRIRMLKTSRCKRFGLSIYSDHAHCAIRLLHLGSVVLCIFFSSPLPLSIVSPFKGTSRTQHGGCTVYQFHSCTNHLQIP